MYRPPVIDMATTTRPVSRVGTVRLKGRISSPCGALFSTLACHDQGTAVEEPVLSAKGTIGYVDLEACRTPAHGEAGRDLGKAQPGSVLALPAGDDAPLRGLEDHVRGRYIVA
ncbi:hypothetical protein [Gluconobacter oxydans]|uniref:hypothetical protein n=1 Tax=Gluconobacter oxydans TaxID=442 RepID=UPI0039E7C7B0